MRQTAVPLAALAAILLLPYAVQAQTPRFSLEGIVTDTSGTGLPSATIVALTRNDSTLAKFSTSRGDGTFTVRRLEAGEYILQITYVGYKILYHDFEVAGADVNTGTLVMQEQTVALDEFVVSADRVPVLVGRDTIVYNAKAFGARPNEVAEDLLRRLPGIEVNADGSIKAHGEDVQNVLVDGKEFFGSDPTIATKNLPAQSIDQVEVYDKESDKAELTGIPDGNEEKTINLELSEDAKVGYFGNLTGGLGGESLNQGRYDVRGNLFRFSPTRQMSILSSANNVNRQGFGSRQLFSVAGGAGALGALILGVSGAEMFSSSAGGGLSQSLNAGLNASQDIGSKSNINGSYFVSSYDASRDQAVQRQQVLGSGAAALSSLDSYQENLNLRHTVDINARIHLGVGHDMRIRGDLTAGTASLMRQSVENTSGTQRGAQVRASSVHSEDTDNLDGDLSLAWRKRLSENGRSLVAQGDLDAQGSSALGNINSETTLMESLGDLDAEEKLRQHQEEKGARFRHMQRIALTQPLGEERALELFVRHRNTTRWQDKTFYDLVDEKQVLNEQLSEEYEQAYRYLSTGIELSLRPQEHAWFSSGVTLERTSLRGILTDAQEEVTSDYTYVLPWVRYRWRLATGKRIGLRYSGRSRVPSITELQPFTDNSDPLRIYMGNPDLRPEYSHTVRGDFNTYDQFSFVGFSAGFNMQLTQSEIVTTRTVDEQLRQVQSRVNAEAVSWSAGGRVGFETPIRPLGITVDISNDFSASVGAEFINGAENTNQRIVNSAGVRVRNRSAEVVEAEIGVKATYNDNRYSLNTEANQSYVNSTINSDIAWYPSENLTFESTLWYRIFDRDVFDNQYTGRFPSTFSRQSNILRLDLAISHLLLDGRGEVRLEIFDVFDQNTGVNYTNTATYVQESRVISLGRYVMLKFIYRPRGKKGGFFGF